MDVKIRRCPAQMLADGFRKAKARTGHNDDGIEGGQGRTVDTLRDGYVYFVVALVGIVCILVAAVVTAVSR